MAARRALPRTLIRVIPVTVLGIVGCIGPLRQVRVDRDPSVPLPPGATWAFRAHDEPSGPDAEAVLDNPIVDQRIERLLAAELAARGYRQVDDPAQAALLVDYHLGIKEKQETRVEQHPTGAYAPITTCQDRIPDRAHDEHANAKPAPGNQAASTDRRQPENNPRDTSKASRDRDTGRGNPPANPPNGGRGSAPAGHDRDPAPVQTCTTKLVWGPYGPPETSFKTFTYEEGTIVVDLSDRVTDLVAWRVVGVRRLSASDESEETLHAVVARLMRDLPATPT